METKNKMVVNIMFLMALSKVAASVIYMYFATILFGILIDLLNDDINDNDSQNESPNASQNNEMRPKKRLFDPRIDVTTVAHLSFKSDKSIDINAVLLALKNMISIDQCFVNNYGEIYLIFYGTMSDKEIVNLLDFKDGSIGYCVDDEYINQSTDAKNIREFYIESVVVRFFLNKDSLMDFMSKCAILSCQRFLDDHMNTKIPLENYYIFPKTVKKLKKFSKIMNINNYNNIWGTWLKFNEYNQPISFPGFPINEKTRDGARKFIMSSYKLKNKKLLINSNKNAWYKTYGKIFPQTSKQEETTEVATSGGEWIEQDWKIDTDWADQCNDQLVDKPVDTEESKNESDTLYVTNLPFQFTDEDLKNIFSEYNPVIAKIARRRNGLSKGFGFVEFSSHEDAVSALALNEHIVDSRPIFVKLALLDTACSTNTLGLLKEAGAHTTKTTAIPVEAHCDDCWTPPPKPCGCGPADGCPGCFHINDEVKDAPFKLVFKTQAVSSEKLESHCNDYWTPPLEPCGCGPADGCPECCDTNNEVKYVEI